MTDFDRIQFKNWTIAKMVIYTAGIISTCLTIGYQGGKIIARFDDTEKRLVKVETWQADKDREGHMRAMHKIYSLVYPDFNFNDLEVGDYCTIYHEDIVFDEPKSKMSLN